MIISVRRELVGFSRAGGLPDIIFTVLSGFHIIMSLLRFIAPEDMALQALGRKIEDDEARTDV